MKRVKRVCVCVCARSSCFPTLGGAQQQMHVAADGRCRMFLGERWPDNGAATAPGFQQRDWWSAAWDGQLELPYWTVYRDCQPKNNRGGQEGGIVVRAAPLRHPVPCFGRGGGPLDFCFVFYFFVLFFVHTRTSSPDDLNCVPGTL